METDLIVMDYPLMEQFCEQLDADAAALTWCLDTYQHQMMTMISQVQGEMIASFADAAGDWLNKMRHQVEKLEAAGKLLRRHMDNMQEIERTGLAKLPRSDSSPRPTPRTYSYQQNQSWGTTW